MLPEYNPRSSHYDRVINCKTDLAEKNSLDINFEKPKTDTFYVNIMKWWKKWENFNVRIKSLRVSKYFILFWDYKYKGMMKASTTSRE